MVLIDTSAWVEFLRDTGSPSCQRVVELLPGVTHSCDPVRMELLAGARDAADERRLLSLLARTTFLPVTPRDYDTAAVLYRTCRRSGETVRKLVDCLVAAVAIGAEVPLLHADADFDVLARHTTLTLDDG